MYDDDDSPPKRHVMAAGVAPELQQLVVRVSRRQGLWQPPHHDREGRAMQLLSHSERRDSNVIRIRDHHGTQPEDRRDGLILSFAAKDAHEMTWCCIPRLCINTRTRCSALVRWKSSMLRTA
jgi:hypothetical protein